jgi:ribonuclease BN (tRNA processing enzyme)
MKIRFLGTNGWYDTHTGNTLCVLIETAKEYIILDAGNGLYKIDQYIKTKKPIYLFVSHVHLDHVIGFHALAKFNFRQGLDVYGPPGVKKFFNVVINKPYTMPLNRLKTKVRVHELGKRRGAPVNVIFKKLLHPVVCYGYRFALEGRVISYCTDTGICRNLYLLGRKADLLISECSLKSGQRNKNWPHLNPEGAALTAKRCGVKKMVLVHFDAELYKTLGERKAAQQRAKTIFKNTAAGFDNMKINL